jgi:peptidoglycan biosynthesis protein MviN/MurJ (putative lipid II flippase)
MVAAGALSMLFGVFLIAASIRPHPGSEAGSLSGVSRTLVQVMGVATGVWLIALAIALFGHDLGAVLDVFIVFGVLYGAVAVIVVLAALFGGTARYDGDRPREPEIRRGEPSARWPGSMYLR